jgi:hypothetical protein
MAAASAAGSSVPVETMPVRCWESGWRPAPVQGAGGEGSMPGALARAAALGSGYSFPCAAWFMRFVVLLLRIVIS